MPFDPCIKFLKECGHLTILSHVWQILLMTFRSDIYLRYPPYLIALSAIYIVCIAIVNEKFDCYLSKFKIPLTDILQCVKYISNCVKKHNQQSELIIGNDNDNNNDNQDDVMSVANGNGNRNRNRNEAKPLGCMFQCDGTSGHDIAFSNQFEEIKKLLIEIESFYSD